ncbi:MAG: mercuric transporter MerT family protein [Bauldia sp.]
MTEASQALERQGSADNGASRKRTLLAAGGVVGAVLASACCVLPLALVTLGVSGAWIGSLTLLEPYKPYVAAVALGLIGAGFWQVYFKPRPADACGPDGYCARPESTVITQTALWIATVLVLLALTIGWWAPLFY